MNFSAVPAGVRKQAGTRIQTCLTVPEEVLESQDLSALPTKHAEVLGLVMRSKIPLNLSDVCRLAKCSPSMVATLRKKGLLHTVKLESGEYEWAQHIPIALDLGCTQAQIDALAESDGEAPCFDAKERAALQFARGIIQDAAGSGGQLAVVREFLSEREIVELIIMAGFYTMLARLTEALGVELDPPIASALVRGIEQRVAASAKASEA